MIIINIIIRTNHSQKTNNCVTFKTGTLLAFIFSFTQFVVAINIRQCFIYELADKSFSYPRRVDMIKINSIPLNSLFFIKALSIVFMSNSIFSYFSIWYWSNKQTVLRFLSHIFLKSPEQGCLFWCFSSKITTSFKISASLIHLKIITNRFTQGNLPI
jgi:hypothetical protein